MKRSGFSKPGQTLARKTPMRSSSGLQKEVKPTKGPRTKACKNRACRARYLPDATQPFKVWCSVDCAAILGQERLTAQKAAKARAERAVDQKRKREHMTVAQKAEPVRKLAQRYAVLRDHHFGCISCDKPPHWTGGKWHGSHFKSVGSNSALQFNLRNIHKACDQCNFFMAGNIGPYETRLRQKIGDELVDWLKCHPRERTYSDEYLDRLTRILRKKIRRAEKRLGIRR